MSARCSSCCRFINADHACASSRLPLAPLRRQIELFGAHWSSRGSMARAWYRAALADAVTFRAADQFATALGVHPAEIWGDQWWAQ